MIAFLKNLISPQSILIQTHLKFILKNFYTFLLLAKLF